MLLHHISLTSGHSAVHRLDVLDPMRIAAYRQMCTAGAVIPQMEEFSVHIRRDLMTILRGETPVILCALGMGRSHAWNVLEAFQETFSPVKANPPAARWLGVVELPALGKLSFADAFLMADFQRYLAAALLLPQSMENTLLDRRGKEG
jgi:hypothetical protein